MEYFPYEPRPGQEELMEFVASAVESGERACVHAPTGFGKTPAVLAAVLPTVLERGLRILWAVRTGNETDRPVEELKVIADRTGEPLFGLSFRGKRDMCLLALDRGVRGYRAVHNLCRLSRRRCPYFRGLSEVGEVEPDSPLLFSEVLELAESLGVCPYYLQISLLERAVLVSLSYNYVLGPMGEVIRAKIPFSRSVLVVDEAHNLPDAMSNLMSDYVTLGTARRAVSELSWVSGDEEPAASLMRAMEEAASRVGEDAPFDPRDLLGRAGLGEEDLERMLALGEEVQRRRLEEGREPRSSLHRLAEFFLTALSMVGESGVAFVISRERNSFRFELFDMRAPVALSKIWPRFRSVVFMSGTLRPLDSFRLSVGLSDCLGREFSSSFDLSRVATLILRRLTTRGESLSPEMVEAYSDAIRSFLSSVRGNAAIFTASYRIQSLLLPAITSSASELGRRVFVEREDVSGDEARRMLRDFKESAGRGAVLVGPMGGRFAEGADFPGRELVAVFLAGVPFDRPNFKTTARIEYYSSLFGPDRGKYLAYTVPALRRASQALGRVIRSHGDWGAFVLADYRYAWRPYFELLPDFIRATARLIYLSDLADALSSWFSRIRAAP
ncbi:MAG: hypothetical protein DRO06_00660 [Thermoproteota archaeon]|nr:MAG: hypothetical protein DRO06_00660 [Candidatus Korarchaeota archaeon]